MSLRMSALMYLNNKNPINITTKNSFYVVGFSLEKKTDNVMHKLQNLKTQAELKEMAAALSSMKTDSQFMKEVNEIEEGFNETLPADKDEWWLKK